MNTISATAGEDLAVEVPGLLAFGVEEEYLLLDADTGENRPVADEVIAALREDVRPQSRPELRRSIVEMVSGDCTDAAELRRRVVGMRRAAADAAEKVGVRLTAVAATPVREPEPAVPPQPRFLAMADRFGPIALEPAVCGLHVHVGVPDRELAVQVCNHLRVWLPVLAALTGNSPLFSGSDTRHASWRSVQLRRWPTVGPTPSFCCAAEYDRTVADVVASGTLVDEAMVYWYARLSPVHPTVEIRVGDVCPTADDTVLVAALVRAAVATAITDIRAGRPAPHVRDCVLTAAHWRSARDGLGETLIDLRLGRERPAWDQVGEFFAVLSPALLHSGDLERVVEGLARLRRCGDGATRQREIYRRTGNIPAMLDVLADETAAD
jgi:glutamate---cysteine ligase / carboxylate-amine ligase